MSLAGTWNLKVSTPMGEQTPVLTVNADGSGKMDSPQGKVEFSGGQIEGESITVKFKMKVMGTEIDATLSGKAEGDKISGQIATAMGNASFTGARA